MRCEYSKNRINSRRNFKKYYIYRIAGSIEVFRFIKNLIDFYSSFKRQLRRSGTVTHAVSFLPIPTLNKK